MDGTDQQIAALLLRQTYDERMEMARFISGAVQGWVTDNGGDIEQIDTDYFAGLLGAWADSILEETDPTNT